MILNKKLLSHYLAYIMDGFILMGETEFVVETLKEIFARQKEDGSISEVSQPHLVCSTGLAQWALMAYRLENIEVGDGCLRWLMKHQCKNGGFWGSYGFGKYYQPFAQISWAVKFFLDAVYFRLQSMPALNAN